MIKKFYFKVVEYNSVPSRKLSIDPRALRHLRDFLPFQTVSSLCSNAVANLHNKAYQTVSDQSNFNRLVPHFSLSPPRLAFLAWGDFHARSRFTRTTIPEEKWGLSIIYQ